MSGLHPLSTLTDLSPGSTISPLFVIPDISVSIHYVSVVTMKPFFVNLIDFF